MTFRPDPKPEPKRGNKPRRIVDKEALKEARLALRECAACGRGSPLNAHHALERSLGGDDVPANILALCGSGASLCHGAFHGSAYVHEGERRDAEWVKRRVGRLILRRRPDTAAYVLEKLGAGPGGEYLRRAYYIEADELARVSSHPGR